MDRFLTGSGDIVSTSGTVADKEIILRIDFFVPLLDAVLSSIKIRFSKQATEFMSRVTAFSPENWVSETDEISKRFTESVCGHAEYYSLEASWTEAQYNLFIRPKNKDGADDVQERTERSKCKNLARLLQKNYLTYTLNCMNCWRYAQPFL